TERPALFLLERLAWEHGLRVVFEAEHAPDGQGLAVHRLGRSAHPRRADALGLAGRGWPSPLAEALVGAGRVAPKDMRPPDTGRAPRLGEPMKLHSWIIAPRTAARRGI